MFMNFKIECSQQLCDLYTKQRLYNESSCRKCESRLYFFFFTGLEKEKIMKNREMRWGQGQGGGSLILSKAGIRDLHCPRFLRITKSR